MSDQNESWDLLTGIATRECPECGAEAGRMQKTCTGCGFVFPEEEEEETPLDVLVGAEPGARPPKIPLEQAKNLLKLREARDGVLSGAMSPEDYKVLVDEVLHVAWLGTELFKTPAVKSKVAGLPPDQLELVAQTHNEFYNLHAAVQKMATWLESGDPGAVEEGFREAEAAYVRLDAIQDQALEKSRSFYGE